MLLVIPTKSESVLREKSESEMENWMRFLPFDFVFSQNEVVFNVKLEQTNARLATYFI